MKLSIIKNIPNQLKAGFVACGFAIGHYAFMTIDYFMRFGKNPAYEANFYAGMFEAVLVGLFYWMLKRVKATHSYKMMLTIFLLYFAERFYSLGVLLQFHDFGRFKLHALIAVPILVLLFRAVLFCKNKRAEKGSFTIASKKKRKLNKRLA
jgi:hypothetical protein